MMYVSLDVLLSNIYVAPELKLDDYLNQKYMMVIKYFNQMLGCK